MLASTSSPPASPALRRGVGAGAAIAAVTLVGALVATADAGVPLRDPGGVTVQRGLTALALLAGAALADVLVRGLLRGGRAGLVAAARERWTRERLLAAGAAVACFYVTYFAYRNVKSVVPLLRPGVLFDRQLLDLDRDLFGGHDPAALLHSLLGTGAAAHVLSLVYMGFFLFIPLALAAALALSADPARGVFFVTALSLTWTLGALSYLVLPSLGPFHADPAAFSGLPVTPVAHMQHELLADRAAFLRDPAAAGAAQSIGAFASLHCAVYATAAGAAQLLGARRAWTALLWAGFTLTVLATVYFGWHFLLDDVGGVVIAVLALGITRALTGLDLGVLHRPARPGPAPEPA